MKYALMKISTLLVETPNKSNIGNLFLSNIHMIKY